MTHEVYDRYDRLCAHYRGLQALLRSSKDGLTPHQKFRLLNEIKNLQARIQRIDKILSIKTEGDWEFSTLAQNYVFWPVRSTDQTKYVNLSRWERIKADPERYRAELAARVARRRNSKKN